MLCDDVLEYISTFLHDPIDILSYDAVFGVLRQCRDLQAVCAVTKTLVWSYVSPPIVWKFRASNVVEIPSLEPQYNYRSFVCTPFTQCDQFSLPCELRLNHHKVVHIHESWID